MASSSCSVPRNGCDCPDDIDFLAMPRLPEIPQIVLCLNFPGSEGWNKHWGEFNTKIKDFHQSMIDFNWRMLEWYSLKAKQLERFGMKSAYVGGTLVSGPRMTIIYTKTISEGDVTCEVKALLPDAVKQDVIQLEQTGYKLCLVGRIFIFNRLNVIVIDYDKDVAKSFYRNCLKFTLYDKNQKVNIFEAYSRVYGGLRCSFILGGIGGLLVSLLTGYYDRAPIIYSRKISSEQSIPWLIGKRWLASSVLYTIIERVLLLKFSQPQRYILSGASGAMCGMFFGICDNCDPVTIMWAAAEFGVYSCLCNIFLIKQHQQQQARRPEDYN